MGSKEKTPQGLRRLQKPQLGSIKGAAMKQYKGVRTPNGCEVTVNGFSLNPRLDLFNHSPTGFEWGYGGSGPAQLALAILADALDDDRKALELHQEFKRFIVASLDHFSWTMDDNAVQMAAAALREGE